MKIFKQCCIIGGNFNSRPTFLLFIVASVPDVECSQCMHTVLSYYQKLLVI